MGSLKYGAPFFCPVVCSVAVRLCVPLWRLSGVLVGVGCSVAVLCRLWGVWVVVCPAPLSCVVGC